jgi:hypothetical protein
MGRTFEVIMSDKLRQEESANGQCWVDQGKIYIDKYVTTDKKDAVFLHEIMHIMMHLLGNDELYSDEKFIDSTANVLLQFIQQLLKANGVK